MTAESAHIPADRGFVPWAEDEMREAVPLFSDLYARRPIENNRGGMLFNHCFAVWFVLQRLQPVLVIESGVYKGQGTWLIEQACPSADIVALDINLDRLEWRSKRATYHEKDFMQVDWSDRDLKDAIIVFDDHQNAYRRLMEMHWTGCRRAIFEDNYPVGEGDFYSLRHILAGVGHPRIQGSKSDRKYPRELRNRLVERVLRQRRVWHNQSLIVEPNEADRAILFGRLETLYEIPPAHLPEINQIWDLRYRGTHAAKPPLLDSAPENFDGDYNYICYVALK